MVTRAGLENFHWGSGAEQGKKRGRNKVEGLPQTKMFRNIHKEISGRVLYEDPKIERDREELFKEIIFRTHLDPQNDHPLNVRDISMMDQIPRQGGYVIGVDITCPSNSCFANTLRLLQNQEEEGGKTNVSKYHNQVGSDQVSYYRYEDEEFAISWPRLSGESTQEKDIEFLMSFVVSDDDIHPNLLFVMQEEYEGEYLSY